MLPPLPHLPKEGGEADSVAVFPDLAGMGVRVGSGGGTEGRVMKLVVAGGEMGGGSEDGKGGGKGVGDRSRIQIRNPIPMGAES